MKMLKYSMPLLVGIALLLGACKSPQTTAYNTLHTLEHSTTAAYDTFIYGVIRGNFKTNDVPTVSRNYDQFQIGMRGAVELAQFNYEAIAPSNVVHLGSVVIKSILEAKAR
jgi:hypothetical protein